MPTLLPSAQKGAEGVGGIRVSQHAPLRTRPPTGKTGPKSLQEHSAVIGKALERLNLSAVEQEAWDAIRKHLGGQLKEPHASCKGLHPYRSLAPCAYDCHVS